MTNQTAFDWRRHLQVHPAADLFPLLSEDELKALADDIEANGLLNRLFVDQDGALLDGRNRLDALALLGKLRVGPEGVCIKGDDRPLIAFKVKVGDPYALVLSFNAHRRHLTAEQKRELIAKVLKARPEQSDRQIAKQVKADNKTVASVRREHEAREEIPHVEKRKDTKGRKQPAKKAKPAAAPMKAKHAAHEDDLVEKVKRDFKRIEEQLEQGGASAAHEFLGGSAPVPAVAAKDIALGEFDGHVLRLLQMTGKAKPGRFAKTGVSISNLMQLGCFLNEVADAARDDVAASADAMKAKLAALDTKSVH